MLRFHRQAASVMFAAFAALVAFAATPALAQPSKTIATLRVMLNPAAAPRGTPPEIALGRLEKLAGAPLGVLGTTRTGALEIAVGGPRDTAALDAVAKRLRADRSVLWAEVAEQRTVRPKTAMATKAASAPGRKLMLRFEDGVDPATVMPRLAARAGAPVAIERTIGNVHVIGLAQTTTVAALEALAKILESDPAVRYADPVRRVSAHAVPSDPRYADQWSLAHVNAEAAWQLGTGSAGMTVAVVDTGMLDHPDLAGRLLPGYDFIADAPSARDDDGRDDNPRDEGDWTNDGDCGGFAGQASFFHGLFVAGQIAANANNDIGIAGIDWAAKILPVRVLGKCGGSFEDVLAGTLWAAGIAVDGAPVNPHPARVINLSLGGYGECAAAMQEAVDEALAQGTVVVVSAGNESDDASGYAPGNCGGVINVGALSRSGDRSGYSNFGRRVDISAPGGDVDADGQILSTLAQGATTPGEFGYDYGIGTSFSAPLVSGTLSLMLARNPNLTVGQALTILQGSAADFKAGSSCSFGGFCGSGMLDAGTAVASTIPASTNLPQGAVAVVEYYDSTLDHYLVTTDSAEIAHLDALGGSRWQRTGHVFYAWADPSLAPPDASPRNVCRFYAGAQHGIDSFYFTADAAECNRVITSSASVWTLQTQAAFWVEVPDSTGACREGTLPVYRFFNNRRDANYRYTIDLSVRRAMTNRVWVPSGAGSNGVALCSLI